MCFRFFKNTFDNYRSSITIQKQNSVVLQAFLDQLTLPLVHLIDKQTDRSCVSYGHLVIAPLLLFCYGVNSAAVNL